MREAEFVLQAEERLEIRLYEVQTLRALDASLAAEIEREERRIADAADPAAGRGGGEEASGGGGQAEGGARGPECSASRR